MNLPNEKNDPRQKGHEKRPETTPFSLSCLDHELDLSHCTLSSELQSTSDYWWAHYSLPLSLTVAYGFAFFPFLLLCEEIPFAYQRCLSIRFSFIWKDISWLSFQLFWAIIALWRERKWLFYEYECMYVIW